MDFANGDILNRMKSIFYRLYTEDSPVYRRTVVQVLKQHGFTDFTLFSADGYWESSAERSLVIEVVVNQPRDKAIKSIAKEIGSRNKQNAIGLVRFPVEGSFLLKGKHYGNVPTQPDYIIEVGEPWVMPQPSNRAYRGKILFAQGDWEKLPLPEEGMEKVEGRMLVRYEPSE